MNKRIEKSLKARIYDQVMQDCIFYQVEGVDMTQIILEIDQYAVIEKLKSLAQEQQITLEEQIIMILENVVKPPSKELEISLEGFWDMTLRFRAKIQQENITFDDENFVDLCR